MLYFSVALPPLKKVGESEKVLLLDKDLESAVKPDLDAETTDNNMEGGMSLEVRYFIAQKQPCFKT